MKDVRQKARDRAQQRIASPPNAAQKAKGKPEDNGNTAFASERERAKEALRQELNTYSGNNILKIAAFNTPDTDENRVLRVAAYCRVSTDDEDQVMSMEMQKKNYKEKILQTPNWIYYGTFVDDGYSGTNTEHRRAFQLMMKHAEQGKFDMIITKSVSRFARNLIDCITWVRTLQDHDPPIAVYFEQEGINTLNTTSNIILFVLAMVAEEESHMKSEAMLISLEWRFSRGRFLIPSILGYDKIIERNERGDIIRRYLRINEDEARTVRLMYYMLVNGESLTTIAKTLTELKRETGLHKISSKFCNTIWTPDAARNVLRNQKYCGDILARKTWTPDFHDHRSRPNRGNKHKYYQADHHDPIVPRAIWNAAQRILNSNRFRGAGNYLPMRVIVHGILRGFISMNRSWAGFTLDDYFYVCSVAMGQKEAPLEADLENEYLPEGGYAMGSLAGDGGVLRIARQLSKEEIRAKAELEGKVAEEEIPKIKPGYQVIDGDLFSHAYDPVVRFTRNSISFNSTCIGRLREARNTVDGLDVTTDNQSGLTKANMATNGLDKNTNSYQYVEFLFNPIEKMVAVRPCSKDHPNAIRWTDNKGRSAGISATALCNIIYTLQNWDTDFSFRIPVSVLREDDNTILLFDLDNYIGKEIGRKKSPVLQTENDAPAEQKEEETEDTTGFFYGADDVPETIEETEAMKRRLELIAEYEEKRFGTPVYEFDDDVRLPVCEGDWDIMAEARPLDIDHRVDEEVVANLHEELLEELIAAEEGMSADPDDADDADQDDADDADPDDADDEAYDTDAAELSTEEVPT